VKNSENVTVMMTPAMFKFLEQRVIRRIRLGEDESEGRHSIAKEIRALISSSMGKIDA
jgi:hypothetical protein